MPEFLKHISNKSQKKKQNTNHHKPKGDINKCLIRRCLMKYHIANEHKGSKGNSGKGQNGRGNPKEFQWLDITRRSGDDPDAALSIFPE